LTPEIYNYRIIRRSSPACEVNTRTIESFPRMTWCRSAAFATQHWSAPRYAGPLDGKCALALLKGNPQV